MYIAYICHMYSVSATDNRIFFSYLKHKMHLDKTIFCCKVYGKRNTRSNKILVELAFQLLLIFPLKTLEPINVNYVNDDNDDK